MSWTKLLIQRRFASDATVIIDLPCARCGYNLRGARAGARCAECGTPVGDSLRLLTAPDRVCDALTSMGKTYLGMFVLIVGCAQPFISTAVPELVVLAVLTASLGFRLFALSDLRFRAGLAEHPTVGNPVRMLWHGSLAEGLLLGTIITLTIYDNVAPLGAPKLPGPTIEVAFVAWLAIAFATIGIAAWFGRNLAAWLGYDAIRTAFGVLRVLIVVGFVCLPVPLAYGWFGAPVWTATVYGVIAGVSAIACLLSWGVAILIAFTAMLHLAEAASRERDELEEAIDGGRSEPVLPLKPVPDRPEIEMDGN